MSNGKCAIVTTTINKGGIIEYYIRYCIKYAQEHKVNFIVIPDKKTPKTIYKYVEQLNKKSNIQIICPDIKKQDYFLNRVGLNTEFIPYNTDNRRNIGFLMALESGCDFMISIDDDNFPLDENFINEHSIVIRGEVINKCVKSNSGWFNICDMIKFSDKVRVYPRGFPYRKRHLQEEISFYDDKGVVHLNAGLWLKDPDLDASTWLTLPVKAISIKTSPLLLSQDTWTPINTQNTALHRDAIVSYYYIKMGYPIDGLLIDRYGDIFSGYFCQACIKHLGYRIRVGSPVVNHVRNTHNYLKDLSYELVCMHILDDITEWLHNVHLQGNTYEEVYSSLSFELEDAVEKIFKGSIWSDVLRAYFHNVAYCMRKWVEACKKIC